MSEKKKKLIIFGSLCLGLLISLVAFSFYIFKNQNDGNVNVVQRDGADSTEENEKIRERIIKKVGYRPYFIEDEDASPLHFSSTFLADTAIAVIITVLTVVALIKTGKFRKTLNIIEKKIVVADKKPEDIEKNYFFSAINVSKYQIILLSVVYLLSFFIIYPFLFLLLSLFRKISSLSAYNYLKQLVKKNKILVGLCSTLGLILSLIIGYFFLYLEAKKNVRSGGENMKLELDLVGPDFVNKEQLPLGNFDNNNYNNIDNNHFEHGGMAGMVGPDFVNKEQLPLGNFDNNNYNNIDNHFEGGMGEKDG